MIDPAKFYVYFYRGGRDASEALRVVPVEVFNRLKPHEFDLEGGNVPPEVSADLDAVYDCEDILHGVSGDDFYDIPDDHFLRVTLC